VKRAFDSLLGELSAAYEVIIEVVAEASAAGATWDEIGSRLGMAGDMAAQSFGSQQ
jgi:hypothetical protein